MALRKVVDKRSPYTNRVVADIAFTVGAEATNAITVAVLAKDGAGVALAVKTVLQWYLSSDSAGLVFAAAASGGVAAGTNGAIKQSVTGIMGVAVTKADGTLDVVVTDTTIRNVYLNMVLPDGTLKTSTVLGFL